MRILLRRRLGAEVRAGTCSGLGQEPKARTLYYRHLQFWRLLLLVSVCEVRSARVWTLASLLLLCARPRQGNSASLSRMMPPCEQ